MLSALRSGNPQIILLNLGVYLMIIFLIIPVHEYAHAWMAYKMGDDTAKLQGRLTLNPLAHLSPVGTLLMLFIGFGYGKPVPINPLRFKKYRKGVALTALAGPVSNLIFAFLSIILAKIFYIIYSFNAFTNNGQAFYWLGSIFQILCTLNLGLAAFNMIPVFPLDGEKVLSMILPDNLYRKYEEVISGNQVISLIILIVLLESPLLGWVQNGLYELLDKLTFFVDAIAKAVLA